MPILQPTPFVDFDRMNPEHCRYVMEVELGLAVTKKFNFNCNHPFQSGINQARYLMAMAWVESMKKKYPAVFAGHSNVEIPSSGNNVFVLPLIGGKAKPLQEVASRQLGQSPVIQAS